MARFRFAVFKERLELLTPTKGISDNLNTDSASFDFRTPEWEGLSKWAHFTNYDYEGGVEYDFNLIDDEIPVDEGLNLPPGVWDVYVHAEIIDAQAIVRRLVTNVVSIVSDQSDAYDGQYLPPIGPSVAEQIDAKATDAWDAKITSASAEVHDDVGEPYADVEISGNNGSKNLHFDFHNIRGEPGSDGEQGAKGDPGNSIYSIVRTSGTGAPGTVDTYTVTLTDGTIGGTFEVYNGQDGTGTVNSVNGIFPVGTNVTITAADVGAVPTTRTVNNKSLGSDITLDSSDVGAAPAIDGVYYGVCSTAGGTQAKTVTITGITEYTTGLHLRIKFTEAQNYNGTAPTLNINSLGAKTIRSRDGTSAVLHEWIEGSVLDLVYDGTDFVIVDGSHATTSYFGKTQLSSSLTSTSEDLAATPKAVKTVNDKVGDISQLSGFTATDLVGAANELKSGINSEVATRETYVRPNLLVNWDFAAPGNQSSASSYSGKKYTIDQWYSHGNVLLTINSGFIRLQKSDLSGNPFWGQLLNGVDIVGKTVTASIIYKGSFNSVRFKVCSSYKDLASSNSWTLDQMTFTGSTSSVGDWSDSLFAGLQLYSTNSLTDYIDLLAMKVEIGDTQTLAHQENGSWVLNTVSRNILSLANDTRRLTVFTNSQGYPTIRLAKEDETAVQLVTWSYNRLLLQSISGGTSTTLTTWCAPIVVTLPNVSQSKKSFTVSGISGSHVLMQDGSVYFSNPKAVAGDLTFTTAANSVTVSGTLIGTTDITATFVIPTATITGS